MRTLMMALVALGGVGAGAAPGQSVQQAFEAAERLSAGPDKAAALAAWQAIEKRVANNPRSRGIVFVRESAVLIALDRRDDAVAAARAGLALLPAADPTLREDRFTAFFNLAGIAHAGTDYATAVDAYRLAEQQAGDATETLGALRGLIQTATFTDPAAAAAAAARANAVMAAHAVSDTLRADFASARAVLALNTGDLPRATSEAKAAVRLLGGLTSKTDLRDASARSNVAIALLLSGHTSDARQYMAMTGAGRVPTGNFDIGAAMTPPDCGGEAGLKPDDMAVVQFSVADDGTVLIAEPIYAAGGNAVALAFARAVRQWAWSREQVAAMPKFLRFNARVELRCNTAFPRPSISDGLMDRLVTWSADQGAPVPDVPENPAAALAGQRAALAAAGTGPAALPALIALIRSPVVPREEKVALATTALALARAGKAPAAAQLALDLAVRTNRSADRWDPEVYRRAVSPLLSEQPYADDPQARAAIRLLLADEERDKSARVAALLDQVVADAALPPGDPLRAGALIRLASLAQQRGDEAAAQAAFARSGLTANQCALMGDAPKMLRAGGDYPQEALSWGFEGWTRVQYDVAANGKVVKPRAIVSYPPFIFSRAGVAVFAAAAYAKTYRPDGALGCGAAVGNVRFGLPH